MASIATTPHPRTPYTFDSAADSDAYLGVMAWRDFEAMHLDVLADPAWPGLRHAARMELVLVYLKVTFLVSGVPIAIAAGEEAWIAMGIFIGLAALLPIVALAWLLVVPTRRVIFDWRARTVGERAGPARSFDDVRLEIEPAAYGHAGWARGAGAGGCLVGFLPDEPAARAYRDRLAFLLRDKRHGSPLDRRAPGATA
jgi:hypothetical protein